MLEVLSVKVASAYAAFPAPCFRSMMKARLKTLVYFRSADAAV